MQLLCYIKQLRMKFFCSVIYDFMTENNKDCKHSKTWRQGILLLCKIMTSSVVLNMCVTLGSVINSKNTFENKCSKKNIR